jgi:hypothetical protein
MKIIWIVSMTMMLISVWVIIANIWITFGGLFKKRQSFESLLPLIEGIIGMIGLHISPHARLQHSWWIPLILDLGCLPLLLCVIFDQLWKRLRR